MRGNEFEYFEGQFFDGPFCIDLLAQMMRLQQIEHVTTHLTERVLYSVAVLASARAEA